MIAYASIEEAWANSTPPIRTQIDPTPDVYKNDTSPSLYCDSNGAEAAYDRLYGSRDEKALDFHVSGDEVCPPRSDAAFATDRRRGWSSVEDFRVPGTGVQKSTTPENDERRVTFDLLLFTLFGILLILIMEQFVNIGAARR
jgi:hypothetical protein